MSRRANSGLIGSIGAAVMVANTAAETTLGSFYLPEYLQGGDLLDFKFYGQILNNSGAAVKYTWKLYVGATAALTTSAFEAGTAASQRQWSFNGNLYIPEAGSQEVAAVLSGPSAASASNMPIASTTATGAAGNGTAAEDLTRTKALRLTMTMSSASAEANCVLKTAALVLQRP